MSISLGPFITCFLVIAFLAIYLHFILYRSKKKTILNIRFVFAAIAIMFLRLCIPINFPFTYTIYSRKLLPPITNRMYTDIGNTHFNYFDIFLIVTSIIAVGLLIRFIYRKVRFRKYITAYLQTDIENYPHILSAARKYFPNSIKVAIVPQKVSPFITGIIHPTLVFPDFCKAYSQQELEYICAHEVTHYLHHDLQMKFLLELLSCIHWWNPLIYWVKREYSLTLELLNDFQLRDNVSNFEPLEYVELLVKSAKKCSFPASTDAITFVRNLPSDLRVRTNLLLESTATHKAKRTTVLSHSILVFLILMLALFVVVDPSNYESPISEDGCFVMNPENTYLIHSSDGYEIYVENQYMGTVPEFLPDFEGLKIYEQGENIE